MAISLYDISVTPYQQTLGAVAGFLEKGRTHCEAQGLDLNAIVESRLVADMLPLSFQVVSVAHHSLGALEGIRAGVFEPPTMPELDYAGLQQLVADARSGLAALTREEIDGWEGRDVAFQLGEHRMPFVAEDFILSFSLPNLHFHATTAYDLLRMQGVPLGKRDYMGRLQLKR